MSEETNIYHLLMAHQLALFIGAAVVILLLLFGIAILLGRLAERRRKSDQNGDE